MVWEVMDFGDLVKQGRSSFRLSNIEFALYHRAPFAEVMGTLVSDARICRNTSFADKSNPSNDIDK